MYGKFCSEKWKLLEPSYSWHNNCFSFPSLSKILPRLRNESNSSIGFPPSAISSFLQVDVLSSSDLPGNAVQIDLDNLSRDDGLYLVLAVRDQSFIIGIIMVIQLSWRSPLNIISFSLRGLLHKPVFNKDEQKSWLVNNYPEAGNLFCGQASFLKIYLLFP